MLSMKETVLKFHAKWDSKENEEVHFYDLALRKLFTETYPLNENLREICIKVNTLNIFYSTRILNKDIYTVAKHIRNLNIDRRLNDEDLDLVTDISYVGDRINRCYSFATKYCSFHKPLVYSIYDSFLDKLLWHFEKEDKFTEAKHKDYLDYKSYNNVICDFQKHYNLTDLTKKDLDKGLWLYAKSIFKT